MYNISLVVSVVFSSKVACIGFNKWQHYLAKRMFAPKDTS